MLQGAPQAELQAAPVAEQHEVAAPQQLADGQHEVHELPQAPQGAPQLGAQLLPQPVPQPPQGAAQLAPQGAAQLGQQLDWLHLFRRLLQHLPASAAPVKAKTTAAKAVNANSFRIMM